MENARLASWLGILTLPMVIGAADGPKLNLGDPAPALKISKWFKGEPVARIETGTVYVVEFWATWCGPCKVSIPHLTEIAHKFKGRAEVIGVSVFESETEDEPRFKKIRGFMEEMGDKMDYHVGADAGMFMAENWMNAAAENGIPCAFIVNRDSKIAWIGHPESELESVLTKVVEGTHELGTTAETRFKSKAEEIRERDLMKPVTTLAREGKKKEAIEALDKILADNPAWKNKTATFRFGLLLDTDETAAYQFARELAAGPFKDQPGTLYSLSRTITERNTKLKQPDYELALSLAQKACELTGNKNPYFIGAIAEVQYRTHEYAKAVETIRKSIALVEADSENNADQVKYFQGRLAQFEKMKTKREAKTP